VRFLTLTEVLGIHRDQISRYGGTTGIRDIELLKSALGIPMATHGGELLHTDVYEKAAAYLFHLARTIPSSTATSGSARWRRWCRCS